MIVYRELSSLERDLGMSAKMLYGISNNINKHYHSAKIPKKSGGYRELSVPDKVLKVVQRRILNTLLVQMPVSTYATAYKDCTSVLRNAKPHVGKPVVVKLDILHFFDSIMYEQMKDAAFPSKIYSEPIRILLAILCYYKDGLPQGAPTSPAITNILMYDFDEKVGAWCTERGISYTRYCDDITLSGDFDVDEAIAFIRGELKTMGFLLNNQKTRIQRKGMQQSVTGIVVNEKPHVASEYRRAIRQEMHYLRKYGVENHLAHTGRSVDKWTYLDQLLGRINFVLQVDPKDQDIMMARDWLVTMERE